MGLNDLQLSPAVLLALYPSSLVSFDDDTSTVPEPPLHITESKSASQQDAELKHLGDNKKNILIVVQHHETVYLPDEELTFLTNMLAACKLNLGDVAIFNRHNHPAMLYESVIRQLRSRKVLLFGVDPVEFGLPVSFPHYQVQNLGSQTFLYSPSLGAQKNDALLKSKLWVCLRNMFGV